MWGKGRGSGKGTREGLRGGDGFLGARQHAIRCCFFDVLPCTPPGRKIFSSLPVKGTMRDSAVPKKQERSEQEGLFRHSAAEEANALTSAA